MIDQIPLHALQILWTKVQKKSALIKEDAAA